MLRSRQNHVVFFVLSLFFILLAGSPLALAQGDNPLASIIQAVNNACRATGRDQLCYGYESVAVTFQEGTGDVSFRSPGEMASLADVQTLIGDPFSEEEDTWGVALARIAAGLPASSTASMTLVALGDAQLENQVTPDAALKTCTATNRNQSALNIFSGPDNSRPTVGSLSPQEKITVNGRSQDSQWLRVQRGTVLGWVQTSDVAVDCQIEDDLLAVTETDLSALFTGTFQAFTLQTGSAPANAEAPNGLLIQAPLNDYARILVNGAQITASGSAFLTAQPDGELTVYGLQGQVNVGALGKQVTVTPGQITIVPLGGLNANGVPADAQPAEENNLVDLLNSLVYGQPYAGPGSTVPGFGVQPTGNEFPAENLVRVNLSFTGDAAACAAEVVEVPLDVILLIDASGSMEGALLDATIAASANFIRQLDPAKDRVSVIAFDTSAQIISPFGASFSEAIGALPTISGGGGTAIDQGLTTAFTELKTARRSDAAQAIVLVSDGQDEFADVANRVATQIKDADIRVLGIGITEQTDQNVMTTLASSGDFLYAPNLVNMRSVMDESLSRLTRDVAARDLTITYTVNDSHYQLVPDLVGLTGGTVVDDNTVQWNVPLVWDTQVLDLPLVVQSTEAGEAPVGSAEVSYLKCAQGEERVSGPGLAAPLVTVIAAEELTAEQTAQLGVLTVGSSGSGTIDAFGAETWTLNLADTEVISIVTSSGVDPVIISGTLGTLEPLYKLENYDGGQNLLSVFNIPQGGASWLYLQSRSPEAMDYTIQVDAGIIQEPNGTLTLDGERITDQQIAGEGRIYAIDANPNDLITVRFTGEDAVNYPLRFISRDGTINISAFTSYDAQNQQWIALHRLRGAGPFYVFVSTDTAYTIGAESGDTLTNARGDINPGDTRRQEVRSGNTEVFTYNLNIEEEKLISVAIAGPSSFLTLLDENDIAVLPSDPLFVNRFDLQQYLLPPGAYRIFVEADGGFSIVVAEGDLTASLKGAVGFGRVREESLGLGETFAAYSLLEGSSKPLREGDKVTITLDRLGDSTNFGRESAVIESADGDRSVVTLDYTDIRRNRSVAVHELVGSGPYRISIIGMNRFRFQVDRGDLLTNEKGALVVGQNIRDSSRAAEYLVYNLVPQLGKKLVEGDVVTINFTNQANTNEPFFAPYVENGNTVRIGDQISYLSNNARQFIGVYEMSGPPPYRLFIPNIGSYVLSLGIGNQLVRDQGIIEVGDTLGGSTNGAQLLQYTVEAQAGQTVTLRLGIPRGRGNFGVVNLEDATGKAIPEKRFVSDGFWNIVYTLEGPPPYELRFQMDGTYEVSLQAGDNLTLEKGNFFIGDAQTDEVPREDGVQVVTYNLDLTEGQVITIELGEQRAFRLFSLVSPQGDTLSPDAGLFYSPSNRENRLRRVYTIRRTGTYELAFTMAGQYTLRVFNGDGLTTVKGNVYWNVQETDRLESGRLFAQYTINANEGEVISVEYLPSGRNSQLRSIEVVNARGEVVNPMTELDFGYRLFLYQMEGPGPYTMTLEPVDQYDLTVSQGDILNIDRGTLLFGDDMTDKLELYPGRLVEVPKRVTYTIEDSPDAQPGESITLRFVEPTNSSIFNIRLSNGNGEAIPLVTNTPFDTRTRSVQVSYLLQGPPPYRVSFDVVGEWTVTLNEGNLLTNSLGVLPYATEETPQVEGRLEAPARVAIYTIEGSPGETISFEINQANETVTLEDAEGNTLFPVDLVLDRRNSVFIYNLEGTPPYKLSFVSGDRYIVKLNRGNVLQQDFGTLPVNEPRSDADPVTVQNRPDSPAKYPQYSFQAREGEKITLNLELRGGPLEPVLTNAEGKLIDPELQTLGRNELWAVYTLTGSGPYRLSFESADQHSVTLYRTDILQVDGGPIPIGILEEPFTNELEEPAQIVNHTLDVAPGQVLTVQLENRRAQIDSTLRDSTGKVIEPEIRDFQNGSNISVYLLGGTAPYTLTFPASGEYEATVVTSNLLRVDQGLLNFGQAVEGELEDPGRVATYVIDGKSGQIISLALQDSNRPVDGELRDANGRLWLPEFQVDQDNRKYNVYLLGGPGPYDITFSSDRGYNIELVDGDVLRSNQGTIAVSGQRISNTLERPAQIASYSIDANPGQQISIELQAGGRPVEHVLKSADGTIQRAEKVVEKNNAVFSIYTLSGPGPYSLEFVATRQYNLTVSEGNVLRAQGLDPVPLSIPGERAQRISNTLRTPAEVAIHQLTNVQPGQLISIELQVGGRPADSTLFDSAGTALEPEAKLERNNATYTIYRLSGTPPYTLEFEALRQYNITMTDGNVLRADMGVIRFGNTATNQLRAPTTSAFYTIDGTPEQVISVQLSDGNRPLDSELRDDAGNLILPWGQVRTSSATYSVYTLQGPPPYTVTFSPRGRYSLTLKDGNVLREELGVIPFEQTISNRLTVPARIGVYTINTEPNQTISVQIENRAGRSFIRGELFDASGSAIAPDTEVFDGTSISTSVFTLTGSGPYRFEFEVDGNYNITFKRGNIADPKLDPVGPPVAPVEAQTGESSGS